ncbi:hypothetical protein FRC04_002400 [Tulasnella sp. 424]|nr:hypothetical protein FRC04_002400 [Tulasnella sp. 424]
MTVGVDVDDWKLAYEIAMAVMIFAASVVAFFATTIFVFLVWLRDKRLSVSDLLAMPLAVGATISALRAAFPPNTELEIFLDEAIYYPSFVLSVSCAIIAVGLTRSSFVRWQKRMRRWSAGRSGYDGVGFESAIVGQHDDLEDGITEMARRPIGGSPDQISREFGASYGLRPLGPSRDPSTISTAKESGAEDRR